VRNFIPKKSQQHLILLALQETNNMDYTTIIGLIAAFCTTVSFIPQVIQIIKTKETKGISLAMYIVFTTGIASWLIYGIMLQDIPIIAANTITFILAATILIFKIKHG
jgi:MtN3 and saliva related transmembrane protein